MPSNEISKITRNIAKQMVRSAAFPYFTLQKGVRSVVSPPSIYAVRAPYRFIQVLIPSYSHTIFCIFHCTTRYRHTGHIARWHISTYSHTEDYGGMGAKHRSVRGYSSAYHDTKPQR